MVFRKIRRLFWTEIMMNRLFIGPLLISVLALSMQHTVIWAIYRLNKSQIVENLCINKSRPELQCEGKCYLTQKLQESTETSNTSPFSWSTYEWNGFITGNPSFFLYNLDIVSLHIEAFYLLRKTQSYHPFVFHPPTST